MVRVVDVTSFITASDASSKAFKTATLLKTLNVNALIMGDVGVGKTSLARFILPDALVMDASNFRELLLVLESSTDVIITNIDKSPNIKTLLQAISEKKIRVISTSKQILNDEQIDEVFSVKFHLLPLSQRLEDIQALIKRFSLEAISLFGGENKVAIDASDADLHENSHSLRRQVMRNYLLQNIKDADLMDIVQTYIAPKLGSNNDYKKFLHIYEAPLIRAGLKKFKSQLQLADKLGLNRNTLRKKIADNAQYLQGE